MILGVESMTNFIDPTTISTIDFYDRLLYKYYGKVYYVCGRLWDGKDSRAYLIERTIKDTKWEPVFSYVLSWSKGDEVEYNTYTNPKITEVVSSGATIGGLRESVRLYAPQRITNQETSNYCDYSVEEIEWKNG